MITQIPLMMVLAITTAGTAQQFAQRNVVTPSNNTQQTANAPGVKVVPWLFRKVEIRPLASNSGLVFLGGVKDLGVTSGALLGYTASTAPLILAAGAFPLVLDACAEHIPIDLNQLWFDTSVSGSSVMIIGTPFRR